MNRFFSKRLINRPILPSESVKLNESLWNRSSLEPAAVLGQGAVRGGDERAHPRKSSTSWSSTPSWCGVHTASCPGNDSVSSSSEAPLNVVNGLPRSLHLEKNASREDAPARCALFVGPLATNCWLESLPSRTKTLVEKCRKKAGADRFVFYLNWLYTRLPYTTYDLLDILTGASNAVPVPFIEENNFS